MTERTFETIVVGGGPAGLACALALAQGGVATALVSKRPPGADNRTTALLSGSVAMLDSLGVWYDCEGHAAALRRMRIIDDTGRLLRAPTVDFGCDELGLEAFGFNLENRHLVAALDLKVEEQDGLERFEHAATGIELDGDAARVQLDDGSTLVAPRIIGADGRRSMVREAAGIATRAWSYPQTAVTMNLHHSRPHQDISTEFHTRSGPFTLVPLPGNRSSLVCVVTHDEAERLAALDLPALAGEIERRSHSILGRISIDAGVNRWPLGIETPEFFARGRAALVGEAAHVIPPIGAQGLNLGLRDGATIAELVVDAKRAGEDPGSEAVSRAYHSRRSGDIRSRTSVVDALNRTLLSDFIGAQGLRGFGLLLLDRIGPLRRAVMREGIEPRLSQPRLMRGELL